MTGVSRTLPAVPGTAQRGPAAAVSAELGLRTFLAVPTTEEVIVTAVKRMRRCERVADLPAGGADDPGGGQAGVGGEEGGREVGGRGGEEEGEEGQTLEREEAHLQLIFIT